MEKLIHCKCTTVLFVLSLNLLSACGSLNPINDYFGIQMNPSEEDSFRIISYSPYEGIKYLSSPSMDANIIAWAEIGVEDITLNIINNSKREINLDFFSDQYFIITDQKEYKLSKSSVANYFPESVIFPDNSIEVILEIPADYSQDFEKRKGAILNKDIMGDFSKNWSLSDIIKGNIKFILLRIDDITLVLKEVPKES